MTTNQKQTLINQWAKHTENGYYMAAADIDELTRRLGEPLTIEFTALKMSGDNTTSLKSFAQEHGLLTSDYI
jgi:hypothetical protein